MNFGTPRPCIPLPNSLCSASGPSESPRPAPWHVGRAWCPVVGPNGTPRRAMATSSMDVKTR